MKTRGIYRKFKHHITTIDKKGNPVEETRVDTFLVRINNAIPPTHKDFQSIC